MKAAGTFYGIGVGPGEPGLLPVLAWERLQRCHKIFVPRATSQGSSTAKNCLPQGILPEERFCEVEFDMSTEHEALLSRYATMAESICAELRAGHDVAYLTLGDTMTYSTFNYTLKAVQRLLPKAPWRVFPGVSSFAALAAATGFSLGEGKQRILILPCPEDLAALERGILAHDIVVLMKVGHRLAAVLGLLERLGLSAHAAFGGRIGMSDSFCQLGLEGLLEKPPAGYLSTLLVRNPNPLPL